MRSAQSIDSPFRFRCGTRGQQRMEEMLGGIESGVVMPEKIKGKSFPAYPRGRRRQELRDSGAVHKQNRAPLYRPWNVGHISEDPAYVVFFPEKKKIKEDKHLLVGSFMLSPFFLATSRCFFFLFINERIISQVSLFFYVRAHGLYTIGHLCSTTSLFKNGYWAVKEKALSQSGTLTEFHAFPLFLRRVSLLKLVIFFLLIRYIKPIHSLSKRWIQYIQTSRVDPVPLDMA